ncbi:hypothetical protein [Asticcacaulis sp. MM231]|uniref:hypothetical protein n=1 Tax=Asticcacaulis sp. MM231 TaxID=3157666 RepID=UPI0032D593ED
MQHQAALNFRASHMDECWKEEPLAENVSDDPNCSFMLPSRLTDKNFSLGQPPVKPGDVYSIRLDHGLIAQFSESRSFKRLGAPKNGEIVILVNAFEFADTAANVADVHFIDVLKDDREGAPSLAKARVVYYSSDVEEGQDLNFSNIPISGPVKYNGRPVGIQIIVLELDRVSASTKSLLKSLAELGKANVAPSVVNDTLVTLGTSLLDGNRDDVLFEYRMLLDNADDLKDQITPTFTEGRYVYRRVQHRERPMIWNNLRLDQNTGALFYWADGKSYKGQVPQQGRELVKNEAVNPGMIRVPYTLESYFTVNVINHGQNGIVGEYAYETWAQTSEKIDAALEDPTLPPAQLNQVIKTATTTRVSVNTMNTLNALSDSVVQKWSAFAMIPNGTPGTTDYLQFADYKAQGTTEEARALCKVGWQSMLATIAKADVVDQQAKFATVGLAKAWKAGVTMAGGKIALQPAEHGVLLTQLVEKVQHRFGVFSDPAYAAFADKDLFTSSYLADDANALGAVLETMADKRRPDVPTTCAGLY